MAFVYIVAVGRVVSQSGRVYYCNICILYVLVAVLASLSASHDRPVLTARASMSLRLACPWCSRHVKNKLNKKLDYTDIRQHDTVQIAMQELRDIRGSLWNHCEMTKCFSGPPHEMMRQILLVVPTAWSPTKYELRLVMPPPSS